MYQTGTNGAGSAGASMTRADAYSYDYVTVETAEKFAVEYVDCYEAFGWQFVKREFAPSMKTALTFKRDRKIANKLELNRLQAKLDEALKQVNGYEQNKTTTAIGTAIGVGTVGALTLGGGMSLCILNTAIGAIIGGVALGVVGLAICGIGYLAYTKIRAKKSAAMSVLIDKQREEIGGLCEQAYKLLNA